MEKCLNRVQVKLLIYYKNLIIFALLKFDN